MLIDQVGACLTNRQPFLNDVLGAPREPTCHVSCHGVCKIPPTNPESWKSLIRLVLSQSRHKDIRPSGGKRFDNSYQFRCKVVSSEKLAAISDLHRFHQRNNRVRARIRATNFDCSFNHFLTMRHQLTSTWYVAHPGPVKTSAIPFDGVNVDATELHPGVEVATPANTKHALLRHTKLTEIVPKNE